MSDKSLAAFDDRMPTLSSFALITGQTEFTRMLNGPSSAAIDFNIRFTAPFEALYQVRPGRGRVPAVEPT